MEEVKEVTKNSTIWNKIKTKLVSTFKNKGSLFYYVLILIGFGLAFYAYTIVANGFTAPLSGDYVYQSVPFFINGYDDWWSFIKTGEFPFWDPNTALGADNLTNNSFYYVMDPLFLPILLFPRELIPQGMLILMIVKMIVGALTMRLYLKYMGVKEITARAFAICYGFCGWMIFYSWFAGFMETISFFPIVLLGIEKVLKTKRPYVLVVGLFLVGLANFYFLVPTCIGGVIYALFRYFQTIKTRSSYGNISTLGVGVLAFVLGLGSAAFLTLPSILNTLTYVRASGSYLGTLSDALKAGDTSQFWSLIFSWDAVDGSTYGFRVAYPLMSFLFPVTDGRSVPIMNFSGNRYDTMASSLFCYTPCIIIFFASIFKSAKEKKISHFIAIAFWVITLFVPFFYYMFFAFSSAYGRWEYLPATFLIIYCALSFDKREEYKKWMFDASFVITSLLMILAIYLANLYTYMYPTRVLPINDRWPIIVVQIVYTIVLWILFRKFYTTKKFVHAGFVFLLAECILLGGYYSAFQYYVSYFGNDFLNGKDNVATETEIMAHIAEENEDVFYRVQSDRIVNSGTNIQMAENYNGISFFHSTYNSNMDQFLLWSRIMTSYGNWTGNACEKRPLLDEFLGVKYYFTKEVNTNYRVVTDLSDPQNSSVVYHIQPNIPFGYELVSDGYDYKDYKVYENKNFINFGFSFDTVIDPHIRENEELDDPYRAFSDFFTYKYMHQNIEAVVNDYNFMTAAVLETEDIDELRKDYPDSFNSGEIVQKDRQNWDALQMKRNRQDFTKTVYRLPSYFDPSKPYEYKTVGDSSNQTERLNPYTDICVYEPIGKPYFNSEYNGQDALFFISRINKSNRYNIFLVNEDGICVSYDNFLQLDNYYKVFRTMYLKFNIAQIIMSPMPMEASDYITKSNLPEYFYQLNYKDYLDVVNAQKEYEFYDCSYSRNTYKFKTNYDERRLIVLTVPYDKGWSCTVTDKYGNEKPLKVYKADGGFNCVMSETGEVTYTFNFKTQYFDLGLVAAIGSAMSLIIIGVYWGVIRKEQDAKVIKRKIVVIRNKK